MSRLAEGPSTEIGGKHHYTVGCTVGKSGCLQTDIHKQKSLALDLKVYKLELIAI